jgi:hypothetical protein
MDGVVDHSSQADVDADVPRFAPELVRNVAHFATLHGPVETWFRQTPAGDGIFGTTRFAADSTDGRAGWLVVCDEPPPGFKTSVPREHRVLFLGEPTAYKNYKHAYRDQFGIIVGPTRFRDFRGVQVIQHPALPWHYGQHRRLAWADMLRPKAKSAGISVFCSDKTFTKVQEARIRFVDALKRHFGPLVHHFGNGFNRIAEKADGLDPYRYTIALENNTEANFWTEKLADAYLGHAFPFYAGGAVSADDLDPAARIDVSLAQPEQALALIEGALASRIFEQRETLLCAQRRAIMLRHNFFAVADRVIAARAAAPAAPLRRAQPIVPSWELA